MPMVPPAPSHPSRRRRRFQYTRIDGASAETMAGEPLSPTARLFQDICIVTVLGLATPVDLDAFRAGLVATLVKHPRFSSIRVMDTPGIKSRPRWVRTAVNVDEHVILPDLDPAVVSTHPDEVLEDYVASLSTIPIDESRPLWEIHVLDFQTSEAASAVALRFHHTLGDGTSLISLFLACTRSAADPTAVPIMPSPPPARRTGPVYALPRSAGVPAFAAWVMSYIVLAWHTVVDIAHFVMMLLLMGDPRTVFTGVKGVEFRRKRFVSRGLSLSDVKHIKNALGYVDNASNECIPNRETDQYSCVDRTDGPFLGPPQQGKSALFKASMSAKKTKRVMEFFDHILDEGVEDNENTEAVAFGPLPACFFGANHTSSSRVLNPKKIILKGAPPTNKRLR